MSIIFSRLVAVMISGLLIFCPVFRPLRQFDQTIITLKIYSFLHIIVIVLILTFYFVILILTCKSPFKRNSKTTICNIHLRLKTLGIQIIYMTHDLSVGILDITTHGQNPFYRLRTGLWFRGRIQVFVRHF